MMVKRQTSGSWTEVFRISSSIVTVASELFVMPICDLFTIYFLESKVCAGAEFTFSRPGINNGLC